MHAGCRAGHNVLAAGLPIVCGAGSGASLACVVVDDVPTMGVAVVPIFETFVGGRRHCGALPTAGCLIATAIVVAAVASAVIGIAIVT